MIPPSTLRESYLIVVSTRPINLVEEAEKSIWLSGAALRGLMGRVTLLDASKGDLADLIKFERNGGSSKTKRDVEETAVKLTDDRSPFGSGAEATPGGPDFLANGRKVSS